MRAYIYLFLLLALASCSHSPRASHDATNGSQTSLFNGDSAYTYVAQQVAFGPRVPGTAAHHDCVQYLGHTLERFGATVTIQTGEMQRYDGAWQHVANICAHLPADSAYANAKRILLAAHYDSRPWADQEDDYTQRTIPIVGANDGASGVGVLLEVARQWQALETHKQPIDIVLFDCEDMGTPDFYTGRQHENTWCLGSQLWAQTYVHEGSKVKYRYGIVLDMVGDPNAVFPREYFSEKYASTYVDEVWRKAEQLGLSHRFSGEHAYPITDDHFYINTIAHIPCIDIIHYDAHGNTGFPWWWHTQKDDIANVSGNTLLEVGRVIMAVIE